MRRFLGVNTARRLQNLGYDAILSICKSYKATRYYRMYTLDEISDDGYLELYASYRGARGETAAQLDYNNDNNYVLLSDIRAVLCNDIRASQYAFWAPKRLYRTRGVAY